MKDLDYWARLQSLHLYSQERRRDRYAVIFVWKCAMGLVDGYELIFTTGRHGRRCTVSECSLTASPLVRRAKEASLPVKGAKMFNLLPSEIRNITADKVDVFKKKLDLYLNSIADEPTIPGRQRAAATNSLLDQIPMSRAQVRL